jgi:hypothetical protein
VKYPSRGALVAASCLLSGCTYTAQQSEPPVEPAPRSEAAGEETLRTWMTALETGDGASGCAVTTSRFRKYVIREAVAWKWVPAGASCGEAVTATGAAELELGKDFEIERVTRTHKFRDGRAYFEVQLVNGSPSYGVMVATSSTYAEHRR